MLSYCLGLLKAQPARAILSVGGIALCVVLMLFLLGVYRGVSEGSLEYIRHNDSDLWVLQRNATNILRCTSVLRPAELEALRRIPGIVDVAPVLLLLANVGDQKQVATVYLAGYDPVTGKGGPPRLEAGRAPRTDSEIVLDLAFASKQGYRIGDHVRLQGRPLEVVGLCGGTNAFVIQYAFVTRACAERVIGFPGLATFYLVTVDGSTDHVAAAIGASLPGVVAYDQTQFLLNNQQELDSGFLSFIYTIAVLGLVVLTTILSLLLSIHILERRRDFAIMKVVGAPGGFLSGLVIKQALLMTGIGLALALISFAPLMRLVGHWAPEMTVTTSWEQSSTVAGLVAGVALTSAVVAMQRLRRIYAMEAFT